MKRKYDYEYKQINTAQLCVDPLYQRKTDLDRVKRMAKDFDECLLNPVKVSYRDGKYWIFDGAHTSELQKYMNRGADLKVDCKVFYGLTWLDECELFIKQNGESRSVSMNDRFRARMNAGDEDVKNMVVLAEKAGVRVDFSGAKGPNKIVALTTLARIYNNMDPEEYTHLLKLIKETWGGVPESFSAEILKGMFIFCTSYKGQYSDRTFRDRVGKIAASAIIREGKVSSAPGANKFARQILGAYNTKAKNRLPDVL